MEGFMKRSGLFMVSLLLFSTFSFAANNDRFKTTVADPVISSMHDMENPAETRARMNTPEVKKMIQRLQAFLVAEKGVKSVKSSSDATYVGSEYCMACHSWSTFLRDSKHFQALRRPMSMYSLIPGKGVVADYDQDGVDDFQQGLDFNTISSVFDKYKPNAPILSFDAATDEYFITIGELTMQVVITQGGTGDWKQRYLLRVPVTDTADHLSAGNYVSPVQFNEKTHGYVAYHDTDWYGADNLPKFGTSTTAAELAANNSRQYSKKCIGCHTTGIRSLTEDSNGEWHYGAYPASLYNPDDPSYLDYDHDGIMDIVNVGCEACHGPGSAHILGGGDPEKIVAPSELTTKQQNDICSQCHVRVKSVPNGIHDWPMNDDTYTYWRPGSDEDLANYYNDAAGYWGDGINSTQHHQQGFDFDKSGKPTFIYHKVTCTECHSPHSSRGEHMLRTKITEEGADGSEIDIPTENDNDTLCLACHATHGDFESISVEMVADYETNKTAIGAIVSQHTNHPYGPERSMGLSRCSKCHMPEIAKSAIKYDIHSHTFEAIAPAKTLDFNMPNSCAVSCHDTKVNSFGFGLDPDFTVWNAQFDMDQASKLSEYYGIGGKWWDTTPEEK
ncbi:MAG: hypothetical protein DRJ14_01385 [Acidobacteria bacterium]|nr:MAG: hypothetical protein DRJ14_01385 [Acidobacteriota bacterium]